MWKCWGIYEEILSSPSSPQYTNDSIIYPRIYYTGSRCLEYFCYKCIMKNHYIQEPGFWEAPLKQLSQAHTMYLSQQQSHLETSMSSTVKRQRKALLFSYLFFFSKHQSGTIWCNGEPPATTIGAKNEELEKSSEILCLVHASHLSSQEVRAQGHARRHWAS